ncbi:MULTISPECIES: hypothetical protein [Parachlamydia]|jgi:hypothetical protein|uniref:Uncharacterized protein n=1 Tax=Parachlamydia acanthamoebae (strain UV7) TaxID=765952 RepID=F8KWG6_PARAV|nr:hypothetical protein [Parachlamydia acanthamoebae]CCB85364.1 unknown protein [Parachlamydia acanthamoebae UV-7]
MKKLLAAFILGALLFCSIVDNLLASEKKLNTSNKIYIQPQDALTTLSGLFVNIDGVQHPVSSIHCDSEGIYIFKPLDCWCDNGHSTVCFFCEGCSVWYCPYRCGCPE